MKLSLFRALPAYLGGKRRLCPIIFALLGEFLPRERWRASMFLDPFCGGGSVALFAKAQGFEVIASDAAERAAIVAWLTDSDVWWLRWNPERTGATTTDAGSTRMGLAGEVDTERLDQLAITRRTVSFQWIEQ